MTTAIQAQQSIDAIWRSMLAIVGTFAALMLPLEAMATDPMGAMFCNVRNWVAGPVGKGIATIAIIVIGLGALMGKVSWGMAILVGIGIALIFGAGAIVDSVTGEASDCTAGPVIQGTTGGTTPAP